MMRLLLAGVVVALATAVRHELVSHDPDGYVYRQHSIQHPYMANGMEIPHWDFAGSTLVSDAYVRLTPDRQSRRGQLWNRVPFSPVIPSGKKYPEFQIDVAFHVHGQGIRLFGDGFALWYTKERSVEGPVFGNQDKFTGMGIFFDTYSNVQQGHQQYISVMIGDGKTEYDHEQDGGEAKVAGCPIRFRSRGEDTPYHARIIYQDTILRMMVDAGMDEWQECFVVRRVHLPAGYFFGVTAATGELADNHDIISLKVSEAVEMDVREKRNLMQRIEEDEALEARDPHAFDHRDVQYEDSNDSGSGLSTMAIVIIVLVLVGAVFAGMFFYSKSQQKSARFNF